MVSERSEDGNGQAPIGLPATPLSARVRLEIAILDRGAPAAEKAAGDEKARRTVLVVAAEADLRQYVRECLRALQDVRVVDAENTAIGVVLAARESPQLLIVDESAGEILALVPIAAIVIVDDDPKDRAVSNPRLRVLGRLFSADLLLAEVRRLLA
jgi:hypothetical protein